MAKKTSRRKKKSSASTHERNSGVLLRDATVSQLERELQKRREKEAAVLERKRAELDAQIAQLRNGKPKSSARSARKSSNGAYTPREGSHGDLVLKALGEGGEWTLDDLASYTGAGKPTLSAAVLPKLIDEGLVMKAGRGLYSRA